MNKKLINLGKKNGIAIEIYTVKTDMTSIESLNDKITQFNIDNINEYSIKAIKDHKFAQISTENLNNPQMIIKTLLDIFATQENDNVNELASEKILVTGDKEIVDYSVARNDLLSLNLLKNKDSRVKDIQASYTHYYGIESIINAQADMENYVNYHQYGASITVTDKNSTKIIYFQINTKKYDFLSFKKLFERKIDEALFKLNDDSIETGKYDLIINNNIVSKLLSSFISMFYSKNIYLHKSLLDGKLNELVFSNKLTVIEDPKNKEFVIQSLFDNEGTLTKYKEIIKDGVFLKKLNDIEYAIKLNEERTGNASGVTNLYIKPGSLSYNDLLKKMNNGIIIDEANGLHAGINPETGNISLQVGGRLIEDGKSIKALSTIILSTNIIELFNSIEEVGSDLEFEKLHIGSPSILFKNITISGKK